MQGEQAIFGIIFSFYPGTGRKTLFTVTGRATPSQLPLENKPKPNNAK